PCSVLGQAPDRFDAGATECRVVAVPQLVAFAGGLVRVPVYAAFPGLTAGSVAASTHTNFLGADVNVRRGLAVQDRFRFDLLGGYRYLHLGDTLDVAFDASAAGV